MMIYMLAFLCIVGLSIGQILFKLSSAGLNSTGSLFAFKAFVPFFAATSLYGVVSFAWVWILRSIELGRVYPLMALSFVLVPVGSHFIFGERFQTEYFVGVGMIVLGIIIASKGLI